MVSSPRQHIICSSPCLQSVTLEDLTVKTKSGKISSSPEKNPTFARRERHAYEHCYHLWLPHHSNNMPKIFNLNTSPIEEESTFEIGKCIVLVGSAMKYRSFLATIHTFSVHDYDIVRNARNPWRISEIHWSTISANRDIWCKLFSISSQKHHNRDKNIYNKNRCGCGLRCMVIVNVQLSLMKGWCLYGQYRCKPLKSGVKSWK